MGTWIYDGGDLAAVVRGTLGCRIPCDSDIINDNVFTRFGCCIDKDDKGFCFSVTPDSTFSSTDGPKSQNSDQVSDKIMPFTVTNTDDTSVKNMQSPASVSSPPAPLKSPPASPTGTATGLHNSVATDCSSSAIKTYSNSHCITKLPGAKRRKSQQRRIMCVPMAAGSWNKQGGTGVPSDLWAWRKYGQKPIKGSPYPRYASIRPKKPNFILLRKVFKTQFRAGHGCMNGEAETLLKLSRGYYRCSSSKGCPARKQIERSHTDPTMLVITYTAEHNHAWPTQRSALARSSRQNALPDKVQSFCFPHTALAAAQLSSIAEPQHSNINELRLDVSASNPGDTSVVDDSAQHSHIKSDVSSPAHDSPAKEKPVINNHLQTNCGDNYNQDEYSGLDVVLRANQMHDHDLFADLGELPQLYRDEEADSTAVDPFNLFNWSSSSIT
ncbi:hypothetical protein KI387_044218 [Taxus chinensis]|uniref:WRKY domain-containing protein n=1 Tax=Taxus chinensis TaxID=29808 RepID=A0AA38FWJ1_TAXCH|nr:hypothetical protein KI387_044218 [Taxus chinensis]